MANETAIASEVEQAVTPVLGRDGYELVLVEYLARQHILRLYIDRAGGVSVDDCARVSRIVGDLLDAEGISDHISGRYHLEVSSPGLDRPLVRPRDFVRFAGKLAKVETKEPVSGRKHFKGPLAHADEVGIKVEVDGKEYEISYEKIARARLVPEL